MFGFLCISLIFFLLVRCFYVFGINLISVYIKILVEIVMDKLMSYDFYLYMYIIL